MPPRVGMLEARAADEVALAAAARARLLSAPPGDEAAQFEVLLDAYVHASFYSYNDILLRRPPDQVAGGEHRSGLASGASSVQAGESPGAPPGAPLGAPPGAGAAPPAMDPWMNAGGLGIDPSVINGSRVYLQVDGFPTRGRSLLQHAARVFVYGATECYACLHVGDALASAVSARPDLATCTLYRVPEGEVLRRITLLRRRWPHEMRAVASARAATAQRDGAAHARCGTRSARAQCGSGASGGDLPRGVPQGFPLGSGGGSSGASSSSLGRPLSEASDEELPTGGPTGGEAARRRNRTLLALSAAAAIEEEAQAHRGRSLPVGTQAAPTIADAERDETLHGLLGFPGELDA